MRAWSRARAQFKKRAAFALLWGLTVHDRAAPDRAFLDSLRLVEAGSLDERELVKKAVDMALRAVGKRNETLRRAAVELARRLARSSERSHGQADARPSLASTPLLPAPASAALPRTIVPVATAPTWPLSRSRAAPGLMLSARALVLGQRTQPVEARVR